MSRRFVPCTLSGPGGVPMRPGDSLGSADIANWTMANGLVRITKTALSPNPIEGGLTMKRWDPSTETWLDCFGSTYGDWCFFSWPFETLPDSFTCIANKPDYCEGVLEWTNHAHNSGYLPLGGVLDRDWDGAANYDNGAQFKIVSEVTFRKTIKLVRGREGYFVGYHSDPNISPKNWLAGNNETGYGEREAGTGGENAIFFASSGFVARHPEFGANSNWGGGSDYSTQRHAWARIDDPNTSAPYTDAAYIAYQNAIDPGRTFPAEQTTGPWWVADLTSNNATVTKVCRYIAMANRLEVASWQFSSGANGQTVVHFVNELQDETGGPRRYQLFIGAFPYVSQYDLTSSSGRANEPTTALKQRVGNRCPLNFEDTGNADENGVETMTAASVRDELTAAVENLL